MYLAQDLINSSFVDSLGKIGPFGLLCFVVIAFIWLVIKLNSNTNKNADTTQKVVDVQQKVVESKAEDNQTFINTFRDLTKIVMSQQDRMNKYDTTVDIMAKGIDKQNELLNGILGHQVTGNDFSKRVFEELIAISGDQGTAITAVGATINETVKGSEAQIMARLDGMPERVVSRLTPALATQHTQTLQTIATTGKSIEDLFRVVITENINLRDEVALKNDTITSLTTHYNDSEAARKELALENARLKGLSAPSDFETLPPDPEPTPPDGSGAKAALPLDTSDTPDLTRTERAA